MKTRIFFANASWRRPGHSTDEAVVSPNYETEEGLRGWCRLARERYGDREDFQIWPVCREFDADSKGKPTSGYYNDKVLIPREPKASPEFVALMRVELREILARTVKRVDDEPRSSFVANPSAHVPKYDEVYEDPRGEVV